MTDERDEIRRRIDIVALVGREVALRKRGRSYSGLCPFHEDRNPSFTVTQETGRYRCWSCGESGDCFTWVMKRQNADFPEALRILAAEADVELTARGPVVPPSVREAQEGAMRAALTFFRDALSRAPSAQEYLRGRDLSAAVADAWELGYAPVGGDALAAYLAKTGHDLEVARELFLVDGDERNWRDKFRGRLIFPIRDERGALVAFGGRILGQGQPKYINSSDTPIYRKGRVIYGLHAAREPLAKTRRAVLCEGYVDVIACHRAGVTTAVASLGTALSAEHAKLLKRWADEVVVLYDSDAAGRKAADRAVEVLTPEGVRVRIAVMPPGDDPDTLLRDKGAAAVAECVEAAVSPFEYRLTILEREIPPDKEEFWPAALDLLAEAPGEIELTRHVDRLAPLLPGVRDRRSAERAIRREVANRRKRTVGFRDDRGPLRKVTLEPMASAEAVIFRALLDDAFSRQGWMFARAPNLFVSELGRRLSEKVARIFPAGPPTDRPAVWLPRIEDEELVRTLENLLDDPRGGPLSEAVIADAVTWLRAEQERRGAERRLAEAPVGDDAARAALLDRLRQRKPDPRTELMDEDGLE